MKKLVFGGLFLSAIVGGFVACKKEQFNQREKSKVSYELKGVKISSSTDIPSSPLKNPKDSDEEKLNLQLFQLAKASQHLTKNKNFNNLILNLAKKSNVNTVYYSELKLVAPNYYNSINEKLQQYNTSIESITVDMTHKPVSPNPEYPETMELEVYEPAILVPNCKIASNDLVSVLSPNIEIFHKNEDCITAWVLDKNEKINNVILSEKTANRAENPIFIVDHAIPKEEMDKIGSYLATVVDRVPTSETKNISHFNSNRIRIKAGHHYESNVATWDRSEFCIGGAIVRKYSPPVNFLHLTNNSDNSLKIKEVTRSACNSSAWQYVTSSHSDNITPYSDNRVYWNTFERDWHRSNKSFGAGTTFGQFWYVTGNARYSNDWYAWIPYTVKIHNTPFEWFGWESSVTFDNWKSGYTIIPA